MKIQSLIIGSGHSIRRIEKQTDAQPSFPMSDQVNEMITDTKYLGVQLNSPLIWDNTSTLWRPRLTDPFDISSILKNIFHLMCPTKLIEALLSPIWVTVAPVKGCCSESKISTLQKIHSRAARIVTNSPYDAPTAPLIQKLGWSTNSTLVMRKVASLIYKSLNSLAPWLLEKIIHELFRWQRMVSVLIRYWC